MHLKNPMPKKLIQHKKVTVSRRGHPELNRGPVDLQSNALPLSYIPTMI